MQSADPPPPTQKADKTETRCLNLDVEIFGLRVKVNGPAEVIRELHRILPISLLTQPGILSSESVQFNIQGLAGAPGHYVIDGQAKLPMAYPLHQAIPFLDQAIIGFLLEQLHGYYLIHAGAIAFGRSGIIFPAAGGSGKTTLVAGCVAEGAQYLSDEVAVVNPRGELLPFAKSMYVREGSRAALASVFPALKEDSWFVQPNGERVWYLPPRPEWLPRSPVEARALVLPTYNPAERTELSSITRSEVLRCLMEQSFNLDHHRGQGFGPLIAALGEAECYRLTYRDWREGASVVRERFSR